MHSTLFKLYLYKRPTQPSSSHRQNKKKNNRESERVREREMRPGNSHGSSSEIWRWNSPLPYLFGVLALILGLIVVALIILSCSHKKRTPSHHQRDNPPKAIWAEPDTTPKIVVIMAGDEIPAYLATPVPAAATSASEEQV